MEPILFFYGKDCQYCDDLVPIINDLMTQKGIDFDFIDTDSKEGLELFSKYEQGKCGGVPFLFNPNNQTSVCGLIEKNKLLEWLGIK